ncbi:MAG: hypothetical protein Q7T23_11035 [Phenylobacterium sp.]|nr:hypothetical protein [Phenylobacterium sp.]
MGEIIDINRHRAPLAERGVVRELRQVSRQQRIEAALARLKEGLSREDRLQMARNLGGLAQDAAAARGISARRLLRAVFNGWGDRWDKRKRYVLLPGEEKTEQPARSGLDFERLAQLITEARLQRPSGADELLNAHLALLSGTSIDPDPIRLARATLDARAEAQGVMEAIVADIVARHPDITWYFRVLAEQQLFVRQEEDGSVTFQPVGTDQPWTGGFAPEHLRNGTYLNEEWSNAVDMLPRVRVGAFQRWVRASSVQVGEGVQVGSQEDAERLLAEGPRVEHDLAYTMEVDLMLVSTGGVERENLKLGLYFHSSWTYDAWGREARILPQLYFSGGDAVAMVFDGLPDDAIIDDFGSIEETLQLVEGAEGQRYLHALLTSPEYLIEDTAKSLSFDAGISAPAVMTPVPAASLAGLIVRNALYAEPGLRVQDQLSEQVQARISALRDFWSLAQEEYQSRRLSVFTPCEKEDNQ